MKLLLDTHVFLWLRNDSLKISPHAFAACQNRQNALYLSIASLWEMQIKHQLGKLQLSVSLEERNKFQTPKANYFTPVVKAETLIQTEKICYNRVVRK